LILNRIVLKPNDFNIERHLSILHLRFPRRFRLEDPDGSTTDEEETDKEDDWEEWDRMNELFRIVRTWSSIWGGWLCWTMALEDMFRQVYAQGDNAIMDWSMGVWEHADAGRLLLEEVERWTGRLPVQDPRAMKIFWNSFQSMHYILIQGITIIETRVSVLNPGYFSVRPPNERNLANY